MTDKNLLLKDLCARLPYGELNVYLHDISYTGKITSIAKIDDKLLFQINHSQTSWSDVSEFKPYLRPMSSMTEEEKKEIREQGHKYDTEVLMNAYREKKLDGTAVPHYAADWCNKHHFDYRGLIEKGLALEAPEGMYETE